MVTHGNRGDREDSRLDTNSSPSCYSGSEETVLQRKKKKTHQNGNEPARKYNWTIAIEGLYYNAYTSLTTFVLFLLLYSLHFYLIKEHFSCGALSLLSFLSLLKKGGKKSRYYPY